MTTTTEHTGTERYLAPELVTDDADVHPTMASDVYALGCLGLDVSRLLDLKPLISQFHSFCIFKSHIHIAKITLEESYLPISEEVSFLPLVYLISYRASPRCYKRAGVTSRALVHQHQ